MNRAEPACDLVAERDGRRRLEQRARQHHRAGVPIGERRGATVPAVVILGQHRPRVAQQQDQCGVERGPGWWRPNERSPRRRRRLGRTRVRQRVDERNRERRGVPGVLGRSMRRPADRRSRSPSAAASGIIPRRACARASAASKRSIAPSTAVVREHAPPAPAWCRSCRSIGEAHQMSKKTVSSSPCRRMSKFH